MPNSRANVDPSRLKNLEDEQEMLSSSLFALTSHFAQVQFRLRQIVDSPPDQRDQLLQSLEEFAFRGIPEVTKLDVGEHEHLFKAMERQRARQFELIDQLKKQLTDVEKFAYDSGSKVLPQSVLVEKQKVIIDELKNKLNLNYCDDDLPQLSTAELRQQVDNALVELIGPSKMKDTLVGQLKTQIVDLERFVAYLQCETYDLKKMTKAMGGYKNCETVYNTYNSKMAKNRQKSKQMSSGETSASLNAATTSNGASTTPNDAESLSNKAAIVLDKASTLLNMFAITQLGCGSGGFKKNTLKKTPKGNHWGDLRAQLEIDIQEIISLVSSIPTISNHHNRQESSTDSEDDVDGGAVAKTEAITSTDDDDDDEDNCRPVHHRRRHNVTNTFYSDEALSAIQMEITTMIRKHFAVTLQRLMEHGLREDVRSTSSLVPFIGCFARRSADASGDSFEYGSDEEQRQMHVWELILEYYYIKNGDKFNETPARKLSQSFNLDIAGTMSTSNKQSLLSAIGSIISIHAPYKRSYNSHFKALISTGLK